MTLFERWEGIVPLDWHGPLPPSGRNTTEIECEEISVVTLNVMGANDVERKRPLFDMVTGSGALDGLAPVEPTFSVFVELKGTDEAGHIKPGFEGKMANGYARGRRSVWTGWVGVVLNDDLEGVYHKPPRTCRVA